ncbi:MAG: T9SS type A sorting domain-containing protein, partial [Bacteroidetes bacterium]|nr:T9SS type A sorting domain-containing protein [Bacteroidota bacterium]
YPENPVLVSRLENYTGVGNDIRASGGYAYLADNAAGFNVINVQDPSNMFEVIHISLGDAAIAVDVFGNYAFVANYILGGVQVINISNPASPFIEGYYKPSGCFAVNVAYNAGHVFISDGPAGFGIYKFDLLSGQKEQPAIGEMDLKVSPNPAKGKLIVTFNPGSSKDYSLSLYNPAGQQIRYFGRITSSGDKVIKSFATDDIPPGLYLLKVNLDSGEAVKKIILN